MTMSRQTPGRVKSRPPGAIRGTGHPLILSTIWWAGLLPSRHLFAYHVKSMPTALVTGATRGVRRGAAIGLATQGFTVFATGRSIESADLPPAVVRIPCDHSQDADTARAFQQVADAGAGLDVLVNNAWGGYERMVENG